MKFERIKPGMVLYDVHSERMGNTTMRSVGVWPVHIVSVDADKRTAVVHWNVTFNRAQTYYERQLTRLREKKPQLVRDFMGRYRLARRGDEPKRSP